MVLLNDIVASVTERIQERSAGLRTAYLAQMRAAKNDAPHRSAVSCGNLAHAAAACSASDKTQLAKGQAPNVGIVTAYNDMLSAHQPLGEYPDLIKAALKLTGATAQIAGGVPAMCDGVTQGQPGMDLSLFSRDVIAMATAVSLSHNVFDAAIMLGVCDKIVPGMFIGAARFGHLPIMFLPAGPMSSGLPNDEKAHVRQLYAEGKVDRNELMQAENQSYHSPGTCTFYGTANSNQMLMEIMGLHLPGSAFVHPHTALRKKIVEQTAICVADLSALGTTYTPFCEIVDERTIVNAIVGLHATGGSTNHAIHLVAMARAAGIDINWTDLSDLSNATPLLCRIYPNGYADVNHFHAAGGLAFLIRELLDAGFLHEDVTTVAGTSLRGYAQEPFLQSDALVWRNPPAVSGNPEILQTVQEPASATGGLMLLEGNIGRAIIKVSAVKPERQIIEAPAIVFTSQQALMDQFKAGKLERDFVAVVPFQGPKSNGMPELHKLTPPLSVLQNKGYKLALVTDGRMSGASGTVPAAIHVTPEAAQGGMIGKIRTGDMVTLDAVHGTLTVHVLESDMQNRSISKTGKTEAQWGSGRELFAGMRRMVTCAERGAMSFQLDEMHTIPAEPVE